MIESVTTGGHQPWPRHGKALPTLGSLEEDGTPAQELGMDPVAVTHIEMAGMEVVVDAGIDSDSPVPNSRIHKRIEGDCDVRFILHCDYDGHNRHV